MLCDNGYGINFYVFLEPAYIIHAPSLSLPSCFKTPFFCKVDKSRSIVRWLTDKVSDILCVGSCIDYGLEFG